MLVFHLGSQTLSLADAAVLSRFLFGLTPTDPATYAGVFALLTAATLAACFCRHGSLLRVILSLPSQQACPL